tara:strand:- start:491 stop:670 length:180 start_codon:yes stop_codon:yes gene_type:complete
MSKKLKVRRDPEAVLIERIIDEQLDELLEEIDRFAKLEGRANSKRRSVPPKKTAKRRNN